MIRQLSKLCCDLRTHVFKKCLILLFFWITIVLLAYVYVQLSCSTLVHTFFSDKLQMFETSTHQHYKNTTHQHYKNTTHPHYKDRTHQHYKNTTHQHYKNTTHQHHNKTPIEHHSVAPCCVTSQSEFTSTNTSAIQRPTPLARNSILNISQSTSRYISQSYQPSTIQPKLESNVKLPNQQSPTNQSHPGCDFPFVGPFYKGLNKITRKYPTINCSKQTPHLVYVQGDTIFVDHAKIRSIPRLNSTFLNCICVPRVRMLNGNDSRTKSVGQRQVFTDSINVTHDYVVVECYNNASQVISRSFLTFIRKKPNLESELKAKYEAHVELHAPKETLSVMMVGIDAISKNNFQRAMPKTRNFLLETMKAVELYKHNKFGHNTFPNVVGLLTGMNEESLANLGYSDLRPLDIVNDAFLWSAYRKAGYRTGMFLDRVEVTGFHYSKYGWDKPPVDYYLREVILDSETDSLMRNNSNCIGDIPEIRLLTDYWVQLATLFNNSKTEPYFLYSLSTRSTHDYENKASAIDEHYFQFLQTLVDKKVLNNTVLVFFSDHGPKRGSVRTTYYGMLENRMPLMFLVFPPWFHTKYPQLMEVVKTNQHRLTTHTDVYETLIDLLYFKAEAGKGSLTQPRISLFKEIPEGRTCQHALIPLEYCVCNGFVKPNISAKFTEFLGLNLVYRVNGYLTGKLRDLCSTLTLNNVTNVMEVKGVDSGSTTYQVTVTTAPNSAIYEGVLRVRENNKVKAISDVTRLNLYRGEAECIDHPTLRQFCYCKT